MRTFLIRLFSFLSGIVFFCILFIAAVQILITLKIPFISRDFSKGFKYLDHMKAYAYYMPEYPAIDNDRYFKPDYTSYYETITPTFFKWRVNHFFYALRLKKLPLWSPELFDILLKEVIDQRKEKHLAGEHIVKLIPQPGTQFVIWGDLQGAFHSLVRDLDHLKQLGFINEALKIIKPNCYFVFNGDLISRSPFNLETLTVVLRLLHQNPDTVFYIRGNHETHNYWHGYGLKNELRIRARNHSRKVIPFEVGQQIPFEKELNNFFNTLPLAMFLGVLPNETSEFISIAHMSSDKIDNLSLERYAGFLSEKENDKNKPRIFTFDQAKPTTEPIAIKALITANDREFTYEKMDGLLQLSPIRGVTAWTLLSCPTLSYQKEFDFHYDAFSIMTAGRSEYDWMIELFSQDALKLDGFKTRKYNVVYGREI
jgi:hypothetical protein